MRLLMVVFVLGAGGYLALVNMDDTFHGSGAAPPEPDELITAGTAPETDLTRYFINPDDNGHPCVGNNYCLVAYMAPWCPYCKKSLPAYNSMVRAAADTERLGVTLVLSPAGRDYDNAGAMAERVHGPVLKDEWDKAWQRVKNASNGRISGVPGWAIYDAGGRVVSASSGVVNNKSRQGIQQFLNGRMNMDGRLQLFGE